MTIENQEDMMRMCIDLYYNKQLPQTEIAKRLYISRASVSRLMKAAKDRNMVRIIINDDSVSRNALMEEIFKNKYGLKEAIITSDIRSERILDTVSKACVHHMDGIIKDDSIIAISRGKTLKCVVDHMRPKRRIPIKVVQLIGLINNPARNDDEMDIAKLFANAYGGDYYNLYAPFIIDDQRVREIFNLYAAVGKTLEVADQADLVLTSLGSYSSDDMHIISNSYLSEEDKQDLVKKEVVGILCGYYYDVEGHIVKTPIDDSIIGLPFDRIMKKEVIAVACGQDKIKPILGALRGQFMQTLITDEITALNVLIADQTPIDEFH